MQNPLPLAGWVQSSLPHLILLWGEILFSLLSSLSTFHVFCMPHGDPVKLKKGPPCKEETVHLNPSCFVVNLWHSHYTTWAVLIPLPFTWTWSTTLSAVVIYFGIQFWIYCMEVVIVVWIVLIVRNSTIHVSPNLHHVKLCGKVTDSHKTRDKGYQLHIDISSLLITVFSICV